MSEMRHERPGVYSVYDASSVTSAGRAAKRIGVAALAVKGTANTAVTLTGYGAGVEAFGEDGADTPGHEHTFEAAVRQRRIHGLRGTGRCRRGIGSLSGGVCRPG